MGALFRLLMLGTFKFKIRDAFEKVADARHFEDKQTIDSRHA